MWPKFYLISGLLALGGYATTGALGMGVAETRREKIPADARQSPGGYRAFHLWHAGIHGGK